MSELIKVTGTAVPEAKGMTRSQVKIFNQAGLNVLLNEKVLKLGSQADKTDDQKIADYIETAQFNERAEDWILANVYPEYDFDDCDKKAGKKLSEQTYALTFGRDEAVKNS